MRLHVHIPKEIASTLSRLPAVVERDIRRLLVAVADGSHPDGQQAGTRACRTAGCVVHYSVDLFVKRVALVALVVPHAALSASDQRRPTAEA